MIMREIDTISGSSCLRFWHRTTAGHVPDILESQLSKHGTRSFSPEKKNLFSCRAISPSGNTETPLCTPHSAFGLRRRPELIPSATAALALVIPEVSPTSNGRKDRQLKMLKEVTPSFVLPTSLPKCPVLPRQDSALYSVCSVLLLTRRPARLLLLPSLRLVHLLCLPHVVLDY